MGDSSRSSGASTKLQLNTSFGPFIYICPGYSSIQCSDHSGCHGCLPILIVPASIAVAISAVLAGSKW